VAYVITFIHSHSPLPNSNTIEVCVATPQSFFIHGNSTISFFRHRPSTIRLLQL
jgi:hypothetical protein